MTRRVLIFQHMAGDSPHHVGALLAADGFTATTVHLYRDEAIPPLAGFDLLLVLGGSMDTWQEDEFPWLAGEKQAIAEWAGARAKPYFGICLGHQLLADALAGTVHAAGASEVGVRDITIAGTGHAFTNGLAGTRKVLQWHHAEVATPPPGARVLASSPAAACQAMALGDHALSTQFHCEWTLDAIRAWPPSWPEALDKELGPHAHARLLRQAAPHVDAITAMTRTLYRNFTRAAGL